MQVTGRVNGDLVYDQGFITGLARKLFTILSIVFFILGLILIGIGLTIKTSSDKTIAQCIEVPVTITRIDMASARRNGKMDVEHDVYVKYDYNGEEYKNRINYWDSTMYEGKEISMYLEPDNPENIHSKDGGQLVFIILSIIGGIFTLFGVMFAIIIFVGTKSLKGEEDYEYYER